MSREEVPLHPRTKAPALAPRVRLYQALGTLFFSLGAVGIGVPLLPTVPFWILAAFFYAKSAPALRDRIYTHPHFGKPVRDFLENGALSRKGKVASVAGITGGVSLSVFAFSLPSTVALAIALCVLPVVLFLVTRPTPDVARARRES